MKKQQWITAGIAFLLVIGLYATTVKQILGTPEIKNLTASTQFNSTSSLSIDSILYLAKKELPPKQISRIEFLEHSISRGNVLQQKIEVYHQLAHFWADSAHRFEPYAWYTGEYARLENSEKSLTFAAHLFLNGLTSE